MRHVHTIFWPLKKVCRPLQDPAVESLSGQIKDNFKFLLANIRRCMVTWGMRCLFRSNKKVSMVSKTSFVEGSVRNLGPKVTYNLSCDPYPDETASTTILHFGIATLLVHWTSLQCFLVLLSTCYWVLNTSLSPHRQFEIDAVSFFSDKPTGGHFRGHILWVRVSLKVLNFRNFKLTKVFFHLIQF